MNTSQKLLELVSRAWIVCDPNRGGDSPDEDDITEDEKGRRKNHGPRWKWFQPRAKALITFLYKNGYEIVEIKK